MTLSNLLFCFHDIPSNFIPLAVFLGVLYLIIFIIVISTMVIFERDKPKTIIIWTSLFLITSVVGFSIYFVLKIIHYKKRKTLVEKYKEDEIYHNLISDKILDNDIKTSNDLFEFNKLAFNAKLTNLNKCEIIEGYQAFKESLIEDIKLAKNYIILEFVKINTKDLLPIRDLLLSKAKDDVVIKLVFDDSVSGSFIRPLRKAGIKVYKFSKLNTMGNIYSNKRNIVIIDGKISYTGNFYVSKRQLLNKSENVNSYIKLTGSVVQEMDIAAHYDVMHASGKFMPYETPDFNTDSRCEVQYVVNSIHSDIELLIIKAICMAKSSIVLQLAGFIPTESIMSLLRFAINSGIEVKLMVPLKTEWKGKYYASRAYSKELALMGATVYLYDGYIRYNTIIIDYETVLFGSFVFDRELLSTALQNILLMSDRAVVNYFDELFEKNIENSYRISNAKYLLLREKFFKNFV